MIPWDEHDEGLLYQRCLVVFEDRAVGELRWWERWFTRPGFRHVRVIVQDDIGWIELNPTTSTMTLRIVTAGGDTPNLDALGCTNVKEVHDYEALIPRRALRLPWGLTFWSCVEVVKAVLGIRDPRILTPYQLSRYLHEWRRREHTRT